MSGLGLVLKQQGAAQLLPAISLTSERVLVVLEDGEM